MREPLSAVEKLAIRWNHAGMGSALDVARVAAEIRVETNDIIRTIAGVVPAGGVEEQDHELRRRFEDDAGIAIADHDWTVLKLSVVDLARAFRRRIVEDV